MQEFEEIWEYVLSELKNIYSETVIKVWLRDSKIEDITDSAAVIYIQSAFKKEIVRKNYSKSIAEALEKIFGYKMDVVFRSEGEMPFSGTMQNNTGSQGYTTGGNGAPTGSQGYANGGNGVPTGSQGYANGGNGAPAGSQGYTNGGNGVPMGSQGYANGGNGVPAGSQGYANGENGAPTGSQGYANDVPTGSQGYANGGNGAPAGSQGYANGGNGAPAGSQGYSNIFSNTDVNSGNFDFSNSDVTKSTPVNVTENNSERLSAIGLDDESEPDFYSVGENQSSSPVIDSNEYTFDNFIVGSSNKFAHAACVSVAQNPAHSYNPLFIYGPSGLGKTHLLYAITHEIHKNNPDYNIIYVKGEEFTNQMIESISKNLTSEFRERYRKADVLLIDDIHFIAGKDSTQEEFFHTFNDLYEHKKQIILTSDRPAKDIQKLEERLRTRFEWGLSADIQPPDFELRVAIMRKKAEALGKPFSNEVLSFLAEKLTNNIRQMEGAIKKIIAYSCLNSEDVTISLVTSCISDLLTDNGNLKITPQKIITTVAEKYNVSENDIYSNKRTSNIAKARHICIYLIKKLLDLSYPAIGRILKRDHTTMLHSYETIANEIKINSVFEIEINEMIKEFRS